MIPDFPHNIRIRLAWLKDFLLCPDIAMSLPFWLSQFRKAKLRQPTGQCQEATKKDFNWANLLLILWGKSGIIKFEFKPTKVSPCSSQCIPCQLYWYLHASIYILSLSTCCRSQWEQGMEYTYTIRKPWFYQQNIYISRLDVYT